MSSRSVSEWSCSNHTEAMSFLNKTPGIRTLTPWAFIPHLNSPSWTHAHGSSPLHVKPQVKWVPSPLFCIFQRDFAHISMRVMILWPYTRFCVFLYQPLLSGIYFWILGLDTQCSLEACRKCIWGTNLWFAKHGQQEQNIPFGFLDADFN